MDWLRENAELLSFGLAVLVALAGVILWLSRGKRSETMSQKSGNNSINVISQGNTTVNRQKIDE